MVCGPKRIEMFFEESGAVIRPLEVDLFINRDEFDYARIKVTEEAGNHLLELSKYREPVKIKSEGEILGRFYLPDLDENISVTEDEAFVTLHDQLKILQHRKVNKAYTGERNLQDIINDLYSKGVEEDLYGVLTDHSPSGWVRFEADLDVEVTTFSPPFPVIGGLVDSIDDAMRKVTPSPEDADYDFEDVTIWDALQKIINDFGLDIWVTKNGLLHIGNINGNGNTPFTETEVYVGGPQNGTAALTGLTATHPSDTIKEVRVRGGVVEEEQERNQDRLHIEGRAVRSNLDSGRTVTLNAPQYLVPNSLMIMAKNKMISTYYEHNDGGATVDVLSSLDEGIDLRGIKPGDFFGIVDSKNCDRNINGGGYFVNEAHHKLNQNSGWTVNLDLIPVFPPNTEIETNTYYFNPTSDKYISREEFGEWEGDRVGL